MSNFKERLGVNAWNLPEYEFRALRYAEEYGIINYNVYGNKMVWTELHAISVGNYDNYWYTLDLDTFECEVKVPKAHEEHMKLYEEYKTKEEEERDDR